MANTWGSTTLAIQEVTIKPGESNIIERRLVPDPTNLTSPTSVLQGAGYGRTEVTLFCRSTIADYDNMVADMKASTSRTLHVEAATSTTHMIYDTFVVKSISVQTRLSDVQILWTAVFLEY